MSLSEEAIQELKKIIEDDYAMSLDSSVREEILKTLGASLLSLMAAAIKARSRASRMGIEVPPSSLDGSSQGQIKQQSLPFEE